jgi:mono/diheme cytochrome c family protein
MKPAKLMVIIAAIALFTFACNKSGASPSTQVQQSVSPAKSATTPTPDELASARLNFAKHCVVCHGEKAEGGRVEVEGKKFKVPSLREGHALSHTDERLVRQITNGADEMPAFKDKMSPQEINDLVRFIRKEFQGK